MMQKSNINKMAYMRILEHLWPLLLKWVNLNPNMDK